MIAAVHITPDTEHHITRLVNIKDTNIVESAGLAPVFQILTVESEYIRQLVSAGIIGHEPSAIGKSQDMPVAAFLLLYVVRYHTQLYLI